MSIQKDIFFDMLKLKPIQTKDKITRLFSNELLSIMRDLSDISKVEFVVVSMMV